MFKLLYKDNGCETENWLEMLKRIHIEDVLFRYAQAGVIALAAATPKDSGKTADAWGYEIERNPDGYTIYWTNDNFNEGVNIAVILQYGHGTGTGGYVAGRDYINPAIVPIFEQIANDAWNEVASG